MYVHYMQAGIDAMKGKDYPGAVKSFDQAAASGTSQDAVTANYYAAFAFLSMSTPNFDKAREYGLKAVAGAPESPEANYAVGEAYAGTFSTSQRPDDKQKAIDYLTKADTYAKAANNSALAQKAEAQIKNLTSLNQSN
jgi:tetratricopeptide (TPR) repeat protein